MGADAVLVNTSIAVAQDPVAMARAFPVALEAGMAPRRRQASATSPLTGFLTPAAKAQS